MPWVFGRELVVGNLGYNPLMSVPKCGVNLGNTGAANPLLTWPWPNIQLAVLGEKPKGNQRQSVVLEP